MLQQPIDIERIIITLIVIICSITLHEFGHAVSADYLGDPGPRKDSRVNLWPDKHFDPLGFFMIVITSIFGMGIGWGKPVMVNPRYFRNPRRDMVIVTVCGPLMNLLLALVFGLAIRFIIMSGHEAWLFTDEGADTTFGMFMELFMTRNLALMFFNMIPVPPLDGSKIFAGLAHADLAYKYERFMAMYGPAILMVLIMTRSVGYIIGPAIYHSATLISGLHFGPG
ncbi:MAG: Zn-dependent protease [Chthonomonadaceae bacterium]|nr:Zn-dependent protease [Chthonomonadaceae bacterium]